MRPPILPIALLFLTLPAVTASPAAAAEPAPMVDTKITAGPQDGMRIENDEAEFSFTATLDGAPLPTAQFHCSLDGQPERACTSPLRLEELEEGPHSFSVDAEDPSTLIRDPTPATRSFYLAAGGADRECEAGEFENEEAEFEEGEFEECELAEADAVPPPPECLLRSARARLVSYSARERVLLVVRYTSYAPTDLNIRYGLGGARGSPPVGQARAHFSERGLFRLSERLSKAEMTKVRSAKRFTVDLEVPGAPGFCRRYETRRLSAHRAAHGGTIWLQSGSPFGGTTS